MKYRFQFPTQLKRRCAFLRGKLVVIFLLAQASGVCLAEQAMDVSQMSLEQLMDIEITSVAKKRQKLSEASAAIYVITQEDIQRTGVTSIPEALRMVPGANVAQIDSNKWAVSIRGFNTLYSNKLLVLIDGRSVYSPFFSGVHWDALDLLLDDIDRIEVIRGPGATLWGANAVNGVINIITKPASQTQETQVNVLAGNIEKPNVGVRHGGSLADDGHYRVYAKYFKRADFEPTDSDPAVDAWSVSRFGGRADFAVTTRDEVMVSADVYNGENGENVSVPMLEMPYVNEYEDKLDIKGGHLLTKWQRKFSDDDVLSVQFYYDSLERVDSVFDEQLDVWDIEVQHMFHVGNAHELIWGANYRSIKDKTQGSFAYSATPENRSTNLSSLFIQDNITLQPNQLVLTIGSKFEDQDYTGIETQPNIRLAWTPTEHTTYWGAISRAVRTPSRNESDIRINYAAYQSFQGLTLLSIFGDSDFKSEELLAYELGFRKQFKETLFFDATVFYHKYDNLADTDFSVYFESDPAPAHTVMSSVYNNAMEGNAKGLEFNIKWQPAARWRLMFSETILKLDLDTANSFSKGVEKNTPRSQHHVRSYWDVSSNVNLDAAMYYVGRVGNHNVDSYTRLDFRVAWKPVTDIEVALVAQNINNSEHSEFGSVPFTTATQVPRSFYVGVKWQPQ